jgi:hypothetical protein
MCDKCTDTYEPWSFKTGNHRIKRFTPQMNGYPVLPRPMVYAHVCHNKFCSNREHLKVITQSENLLDNDVSQTGTVTHCVKGHLMDESNTRITKAFPSHSPQRVCRTCNRNRMRVLRESKKGRP